MKSGHYLFHEEQSYRNSWVLFPLALGFILVVVVQVYGMYQQLYLGEPWGEDPMPDSTLVIVSVSSIVLFALIAMLVLNLRLITEVRRDGFYYRFPILINKLREIRKDEIERYEVGKYNPIMEYGGWGIRTQFRRKKAYNVKGNQGVKFFLRNGKVVLFGTQKPEELRNALDKMMTPTLNI